LLNATAALANAPCELPPRESGLETRPGFVEFMSEAKLNPLKNVIPYVNNSDVQNVIQSPDTMWYDEDSIVFMYQDGVESVVGNRANCVGRKVGEANRNNT